jgi:hypothetical protein
MKNFKNMVRQSSTKYNRQPFLQNVCTQTLNPKSHTMQKGNIKLHLKFGDWKKNPNVHLKAKL